METTTEKKAVKHLIVVCLTVDDYYKSGIQDIIDFSKELSFKVQELDHLLVVCPERLAKYMQSGYAPGTYLIISKTPLDIWVRDFGLVLPNKQIKFTYRPKYLKKGDAKEIETRYMKILASSGIKPIVSNIVLDGGNVVDNGTDKLLITRRILKENKGKSEEVLKKELECISGYKVAFIPDTEDSTGHADGIVAFVEEDVLLIGDDGDREYFKEIQADVTREFPSLTVGSLRCPVKSCKWRKMDSALGDYINVLVTDNAVYVPAFSNEQEDEAAVKTIQKYTKKRVLQVNTAKLSHMGGSVRCMTWQISVVHEVAQLLITASSIVQ